MRRSAVAAPLLAFTLALAACDGSGPDLADAAPGAGARGGPPRVALCHYDASTGTFARLDLPAPAASAHLGHGDGQPGGPVVGQPGATFDEACVAATAFTFVDFGGESGTTGDVINNAIYIRRFVPSAYGDIRVEVALVDPVFPVDEGFKWIASTFRSIDGAICRWPIVSVRARAELDGTIIPLEFDGYEAAGFVSAPLPWEGDDGDRPTLFVESVTFDAAPAPSCL